MADLMLLLLAFMATLAAVGYSVVIVHQARRQRALQAQRRERDSKFELRYLDDYIKRVEQVRTPEDLERLAQRERERQRKWDGSF